MQRTHTCGELTVKNVEQTVTLYGWVQRVRNKGKLIWIDLRDRYGITQLIFEHASTPPALWEEIQTLQREYVISVQGMVITRSAKNESLATGDIEIKGQKITLLNAAKLPPFVVENATDGDEALRMQYRYLALRHPTLQRNLALRHQVMQHTRTYLDKHNFLEIETPLLIRSTPEGARDFVVPSRMQKGEFYALPQSPQMCKQLLMIGGLDRYYQFARCFRDEDLRADRQPEFTQIDCELSFVNQERILNLFEAYIRYLFKSIRDIDLPPFARMSYKQAIQQYGTDKPDVRLGMPLVDLTHLTKQQVCSLFDQSDLSIGICVKGCANYTRKQLDSLGIFMKTPPYSAQGMVYIKYNTDGSIKSSVDKFFNKEALHRWVSTMHARPGDLILIGVGEATSIRQAVAELRLKLGKELGLQDSNKFAPLWIVDFPLVTWDTHEQRYQANHHPFTAPCTEDLPLLMQDPASVKSQAYDLVINGVEIGGGSIRIHTRTLQEQLFQLLGFSKEEALQQFGCLLHALEYGTPPHGGIALGLDRLCALLAGESSIRSFIAFPKNNAGRDVMLAAPAPITPHQRHALHMSQ